MRQIILDTETTGLDPNQGHRIIEIGCVELVNRRFTGNHYHQYINPERAIDDGALKVHGISNEFLDDKPVFAQIAKAFIDYIGDSELVIHNAPFDVGFINHEYRLLKKSIKPIDKRCKIVDTLDYARKKHPGKKNNLDALCKRYHIDNSNRTLHGALLDADILAHVYLAMTGGQAEMFSEAKSKAVSETVAVAQHVERRAETILVKASAEEEKAHQDYLQTLREKCGGTCVWDDGQSD